jgi:hypothetical protein
MSCNSRSVAAHTVASSRSGEYISDATLRRCFERELEFGAAELEADLGNFMINTVMGKKPKSGLAIRSDSASVHAAEFMLERRFGWNKTDKLQLTGKDDGPVQTEDVSAKEILREELYRIRERLDGGEAGGAVTGGDGSRAGEAAES